MGSNPVEPDIILFIQKITAEVFVFQIFKIRTNHASSQQLISMSIKSLKV